MLVKLDQDLNRMAHVNVTSNDSPTNDMFLVGDGDHVYVGKYSPSNGGHLVYEYDKDLNPVSGAVSIGGYVSGVGDISHSNGAAAYYLEGGFHLVAPQTLSPGDNDLFYHMLFDDNWTPLEPRRTIYSDPGMIGMVPSLVYCPCRCGFMIFFPRRGAGEQEVVGPIHTAVYDESWTLRTDVKLLDGSFERPHAVIVGDVLYIGYDGQDNGYHAYVSKLTFSLDDFCGAVADQPAPGSIYSGVLVDLKFEGGDGPVSLQAPATVWASASLVPGDSEGLLSDWWLVVVAPDGLLIFDASHWKFIGDDLSLLTPVGQAGLFGFDDVALPPFAAPFPGTYYLIFGVDEADGVVNGGVVFDYLELNVTEGG